MTTKSADGLASDPTWVPSNIRFVYLSFDVLKLSHILLMVGVIMCREKCVFFC